MTVSCTYSSRGLSESFLAINSLWRSFHFPGELKFIVSFPIGPQPARNIIRVKPTAGPETVPIAAINPSFLIKAYEILEEQLVYGMICLEYWDEESEKKD